MRGSRKIWQRQKVSSAVYCAGISSAEKRPFQKTRGRMRRPVGRAAKIWRSEAQCVARHPPQIFRQPPAGRSDSVGTCLTGVGCRCGRCPQVHGETAECFSGEISSF
ncbi:hypothetical protein PFLUV_G00007310 [Perca fluviatilis]|uniref:Uncharacterized protein n=1 Tax=Perca fluviatilis TaxID=8168 RepID=A0A6A5F0P1_PERFL|nr:hypothetical protein PFLUV_G00007310 [Perca fluviatilis]